MRRRNRSRHSIITLEDLAEERGASKEEITRMALAGEDLSHGGPQDRGPQDRSGTAPGWPTAVLLSFLGSAIAVAIYWAQEVKRLEQATWPGERERLEEAMAVREAQAQRLVTDAEARAAHDEEMIAGLQDRVSDLRLRLARAEVRVQAESEARARSDEERRALVNSMAMPFSSWKTTGGGWSVMDRRVQQSSETTKIAVDTFWLDDGPCFGVPVSRTHTLEVPSSSREPVRMLGMTIVPADDLLWGQVEHPSLAQVSAETD